MKSNLSKTSPLEGPQGSLPSDETRKRVWEESIRYNDPKQTYLPDGFSAALKDHERALIIEMWSIAHMHGAWQFIPVDQEQPDELQNLDELLREKGLIDAQE